MKPVAHFARAAARRLWLARNSEAFRDSSRAERSRLLVDVSVIMRHDAATGIQRVVRSVWSNLAKLHSPHFDVVPVHASATHGYCYAPVDFLTRKPKPSRIPVGVRSGDKFLGLDLTAHFLPYYSDQLRAWRENGASLHFIVYDLLPLSRPDWFESATSHHFAKWFDTVVSVGDQALCISEEVAQDLRRRIVGTPANDRLEVGRLQLSGDISDSLPSVGLSRSVSTVVERARARRTILMIGTIEPRKGYDRALDAFERLWANDESAPDLVIVGKGGWKTAALQERIRKHPEHGRRLHWLENVSDQALTEFYEACLGVFIASYNEGFGLPVVEAATHGRWALVRDVPVFREQRLPSLRYFSDDSPEALSRELLALVRTAEATPPPATALPKWSRCVRSLVEEIGLEWDNRTESTPALRLVS